LGTFLHQGKKVPRSTESEIKFATDYTEKTEDFKHPP